MSRKFTFRLQPVLDQRDRVEKDRTRVVAELERERLAAEDRLRGLQRQIEQARADLRDRLHSGSSASVSVSDVRMQAGALIDSVSKAHKSAIELAGCYQRVDAGRRELLKAATARKAVDLLRERRLMEWRQAQAKREGAELDEIVSARSARSAMGME